MNWQFICIISLSLYLAQKLFFLINLVWLAFGFDSGLNNIVLIKRKFVFLIWVAGDEFKLCNAVRGRFFESAVLSYLMNDFPVIGYPCFAHRILGSPGGKHCESLQRNVWRGVVSPLKTVSSDIECRILP